jgi:hypothetical protein
MNILEPPAQERMRMNCIALVDARNGRMSMPARQKRSMLESHFRSLISTLLIATMIGISTYASAVHVATNGVGQVLLFPYYTVRATTPGVQYNTLVIVTNTAADTKVLRVRFRESKNGRPVASMNVYLVPNDSWTAGIVPTTDLIGAAILSYDQSCVDPPLPVAPATLAFSNAQYSGANTDFEDDSLARTSEGYIEVFELGVVKDSSVLAALQPDRTVSGVVPDCGSALAVSLDTPTKIGAPTGGLMGSGFIVNVFAGTLYSYDAAALDDFSRVALWSRATATGPTLEDVNPKVSRIFDGASVRENSWDVAKGAHPADPVSAALMQNELRNYFVLDSATASATDWIVTMPTKPHYASVVGTAAPPPAPFASRFNKGGAPDSFETERPSCYGAPAGATVTYDREGHRSSSPCPGFPILPPHTPFALAWTANVVTFINNYGGRGAGVFGSGSSANLELASPLPGDVPSNGWTRLAPFPNSPPSADHKLTSTDSPPVTFYGLPMIGFMANSFYNGNVPDPAGHGVLLSAYGATSPHKVKARIE